ncbi:hypothetical protein K3555_13695 [Leisingera sp. M527]|uniref:hypothetical protein n=1 Tax=Leisingera sp. M527 TaxID=2867014 RepID=UPI0021A4C852|nr:hypothetical protein [Leisingera sp. M527]UWQ31646.1 hypothetical protein K3555_13695 [Leisingera sp. M527]
MDTPPERNKDVEHLAGMISAGLTLFIMVNAIDGYFETVFGYFADRLPYELAYLATLVRYALGAGIGYKFFKIVLTAILLSGVIGMLRTGSPLAVLGF